MATIVTRAGKGSALTHTEMDDNFTNLNNDKPDVVGTPTTNNVATFDASDDIQDSGYSFSGLVGDTAITKAEIDILDGATLTTAELNILDGVTATTAELNKMDGVTATTGEINWIDGVTSPIQTQLGTKAPLASPTFTGTPSLPTGTLGVTQSVGNDSTRLATTAFVSTSRGGINTKVIDIGDWNMDITLSVNVAHGLTFTKIRSLSVIIRDDSNSTYHSLPTADPDSTLVESVRANSANVTIVRGTSGTFDGAGYDSTSYNRGWITIQYTD